MAMSTGPGAEARGGVMGFHAGAGRGFALREGVLASAGRSAADWRGGDESTDSDDPRLPPLRLGASYADSGGAALASPPGSSSSSDAFLSMSSTPSGLQNPYGVWSPRQAPSEASSSEMEFRSAREYDTADLFFGENWLYDDHLFHREPESDKSGNADEEDKFIIAPDVVGSWQSETCGVSDDSSRRHARSKGNADSGGCAEVYTSPPCGCCLGEGERNGQESVSDSWSAVYGRYQIMDDLTEVLDECGADAHQFRRNVDDDGALKGGPLVDSRSGHDDLEFDLSALEKELQMLSPYLVEDADALSNRRFDHDFRVNDGLDIDIVTDEKTVDDKENCPMEKLSNGVAWAVLRSQQGGHYCT